MKRMYRFGRKATERLAVYKYRGITSPVLRRSRVLMPSCPFEIKCPLLSQELFSRPARTWPEGISIQALPRTEENKTQVWLIVWLPVHKLKR